MKNQLPKNFSFRKTHVSSEQTIAKNSSPVKKFSSLRYGLASLLFIAGVSQVFSQTQTFTSSGTFNVPVGVNKVTVEMWGGGGAGGGVNANGGDKRAGGGGAGGNYRKTINVSVTSGGTAAVVVGAAGTPSSASNGGNGGNSTFPGAATVNGGGGGKAGVNGDFTGSGGSIGGGSPDFSGAVGGGALPLATTNTDATSSGAGGGGAGSAANGSGVTGGTPNGGNGAPAIALNGSGSSAATAPGGGGGGAYDDGGGSTADRIGGAGAAGQVIVTWTQPTPAITIFGPDPTNGKPVFKVVFSTPINVGTFLPGSVSFAGSGAPGVLVATIAQIAPSDGTTFTITVSGMTGSGTVIAKILLGQLQDVSGNDNIASNLLTTINYIHDVTKPDVAVTIPGANPTNVNPVFRVVFSEPITLISFVAGDVTLTGTALPTTATILEIAPNDGTTFNVTASGMTAVGTVIFNMAAGVVDDRAATPNTSTASTPANVTINFDNVAPTVTTTSLGTITPSSFILTVNISKAVTTYYEVTTSATPPTAVQIKAGTGPSHFSLGNFPVPATTPTPTTISGLAALTQYYVYTVSEDAALNQSTPVTSNNATTICTVPGSQVTASVAPAPFTLIGAISMRVNWTRGTGTGGVIVLAHQTSAVTYLPISGNNYSGQINSNYTTAPALGTGDKIVYRGPAAFIDVTGLIPSTTYHFAVYEYNTVNDCYLLTSPLIQNQATIALANETTVAGGTGVASISSLVVTQPAEVSFFVFNAVDAGADLAPTEITQMVFKPGPGNAFGNFQQLIGGARLYDNAGHGPLGTVTINTGDITVASIPSGANTLGEVPNGTTKIYTLKIFLTINAAIKATADGQKLVLSITDTDVTATAGFSGMSASTTDSGAGGLIDVVATELRFVTGPSNTLLRNTMTSVTVQATDLNGVRDVGVISTIGILSSGSLTLSPQDAVFALGVGTYSGIVHTATNTLLTLTTNSVSLANPVSANFDITASSASDIIANTSFPYPTNIAYDTYQENVDILNSGSSIVVGMFDIRDGGATLTDADGAGTILSSLRLDLGSNFNMIRRIALYDIFGTTEIVGTEQVVGSQIITFAVPNLTAPDNSSASFTVRVSFKTAVTDNAQISFLVTATTSTQANVSSTFAATNAGGAITSTTGNNNRIEVLANKLDFVTQPSNVVINAIMSPSPTVIARDALNNTDVDFISSVNVTSTGSLVGSPQSATFVAGVGTYNSIVHNGSGNNLQLTATFVLLTPGLSTFPFTIIAMSSDIVANPLFIGGYPTNIPYNSFQELSNIQNTATSVAVAAFNLRDGGGAVDGDLLPTTLTNLSLDLGVNFNVIRRIAFFDATNTKIPGTEQDVSAQIVNFSGFSLSAPYGIFTTFSVRVSFKAPVTDNLQFSFTITSATALPSVSSQFINGSAGGAFTSTAGNDNRIEVTADRLQLVQQPTNTLLGVAMSPSVTVEATDILNSRDLDNTALHGIISTGVLSASPQNAFFVAGLGTYPGIIHTSTGAGLQLQTVSVSLSNTASTTFNITASNASNITVNAFAYPQNIAYDTFQENFNILNSGTSLVVAKFDIKDGGGADADLAPTILTSLSLDLGPNFGYIRRIALYDASGSTEISELVPNVSSQVVTFPGFSINVPDNGLTSFTVRVSFTTAVVDNQQFAFTISAAGTQPNVSSLFALPNAGGAATTLLLDNNRIEVTAIKLFFTTNPAPLLLPSVALSAQLPIPVIKAFDFFNNTDLDYANNVTLVCALPVTPSNTLTSDFAAPNAGVYTFPGTFQYTTTGNGALTASAAGLASASSSAVSVQAGSATKIALGPAAPATISSSSVAATTAPGVTVFNFNVTDDQTPTGPGNDDGLPTLITDLTITSNPTNNSITDWTQAIAGATLVDGQGHTKAASFILTSPNRIIFNSIPVLTNAATSLGYVDDSTTKNYTLKIYLRTALLGALPTTIDGLGFEFEVLASNFGLAANSTFFVGGQSATSGNADKVAVVATQLKFVNPSIATFASLNTNFPGVVVEAIDVNNNRDLNFTGAASTVRFFNNATPVSMSASAPQVGTTQFTSGLLNFSSTFQYISGTNGNDVTLEIRAGVNANCAGADYTTGAICGFSPLITLQSSFESQVKGDPAYSFSTNVPYATYQAANIQPVDITNGNGSYELARMLLSDGDADGIPGDADGAATTLTDISIRIADAADISTLGHIRRIALYNSGFAGATEIADVTVTGTDLTNGFVKFSGLNIVAPDDNVPTATTISIRVSFNNTAVTIIDKTLLRVSVVGATLSGGSAFRFGDIPADIGGISGGLKAPINVNFVNVVATKLDFTTQPAPFAGVNEAVTAGIVEARDQFNILDLDHIFPAAVTAPSATPNGIFKFVSGVLNMGGLITYGNEGDGTLTVTSNGLTSNVSFPCSHVDVIQITAARQDGGAGGVPAGAAATLQAGTSGQAIFGVQFNSAYNITSPSKEPRMTSFTIDFSQSYGSIFSGIKVIESTSASPVFNPAAPDVVTSASATYTFGPTSLTVAFPITPRDFTVSPTYTYFVVADVAATVNGSTSPIQLSVVDAGTGSSTQGNIIATSGSQLVNVLGPTYSFASIQPPSLISSYPALGQDNVDITQPSIELTFTVPVFSLDGIIKLTDASTSVTTDLPLSTLAVPNGAYSAGAGTTVSPIIFTIPPGTLVAGRQYYVSVAQGVFNGKLSATNTGIMDVNQNVFEGISYSGTLYFKTTDGKAPKLLGANTAVYAGVNATAGDPNITNLTSFGASLNGTFNKNGNAYFLVLKNSAGSPTNGMIKNSATYTTPADVVASGSFAVNASTTIAQFGTITPTSGSFTPGVTHYVWITADATSEKSHVVTFIPTGAPYGSAASSFAEVGVNVPPVSTGPTLTFTSPAAGNNASGSGGPFTSLNVTSNLPVITFCSDSYQILNIPIVFYEGTAASQQFTGAGTQTMNLVLPAGFVFDVTKTVGGPKYGTVTLQGTDFPGFPIVPLGVPRGNPTIKFLSTTVMQITFVNNGATGSRDQIIISNLRVLSSAAGSGAIFRLGGTALPTITDGSTVAGLRAQDATVVNFDNSYSQSLGVSLPATIETAIPDNYIQLPAKNSLVTLTPYITNSYDNGPSTFGGQGININTLNLKGVTLDNPFNITITHTDQNGCNSQNNVQYVVYDHTKGIKISSIPVVVALDQGPYCASNVNFQIGQTLAAPSPGTIRYITFDNLTTYNLVSLVAKIPVTSVAGLKPPIYINPTDFVAAWPPIINVLPLKGAKHTVSLVDYFDYSFDDHSIVDANTINGNITYVYDLSKATTNPNSNFGTISPGVFKQGTYYGGGTLGFVEFTGNFRNVSNPAVSINRRQIIEFYIPSVPIVEMVTPYSSLEITDPNNAPGSGGAMAGPNNPGTMIYCQGGGLININGLPAAAANKSIGTFTLVKIPSNVVIYDKSLSIIPAGFTDNSNGTAVLDPNLITNAYQDIKIIYTYKENNSPCTNSGYQIIRVTPNPVASYTEVSLPSFFVDATVPTAFCQNQAVAFDGSGSTVTGGGATLQRYTWNFTDATNSVSSNPNVVSGPAGAPAVPGPPIIAAAGTADKPIHTFIQSASYNPTLIVTSNFGCSSQPSINLVKVGGIPVVKMKFDGIHVGPTPADEFHFQSNGSTISANDNFKSLDWTFGDLTPNLIFAPPGSPSAGTDASFNSTIFAHNYTTPGQKVYDLKVTTGIGCVNSLFLDNKYHPNSPVGTPNLTDPDNALFRTLIVLDLVPVASSSAGYYQDFEGSLPGNWVPWFASNSTFPLTLPAPSVSWILANTAGNYGTYAKPDPTLNVINGVGFFRNRNSTTGLYTGFERSALYSPSFDLSALLTPMISYNSLVQMENSDGVILEYSTDNLNVTDPNKVWKVLGLAIGEGVGWFPDKGIASKPGKQVGNDFGWSGSGNQTWFTSKHTLDEIPNGIFPTLPKNVVLRFALASAKSIPTFEGFAVDNVRVGERTRTILLESFMNAANSSPSAKEKIMSDSIALFYPAGSIGTQVIKLNHHVNFPANDPFNLDNPADPSSRSLYYGIETTPKSRLDGAKDPKDRNFSAWSNTSYGIRSLALAQAAITINTSTPSAGKLKIDVSVKAIFPLPANTILHVVIVEALVKDTDLSPTQKALIKTGETNFEYVPKQFLTLDLSKSPAATILSASGTRFGTILPVGSTNNYSFVWTPEPKKLYGLPNDLAVVAFVQQENGAREIFQANHKIGINDPVSPVVTGLEPISAEDITVYPIPANHEMHIQLPGKLGQPAGLQMIDQVGRTSVAETIPEGASSKTINTRDLSPGVYILMIDIGNGNITRKKVMVVH